MNLFDVVDVECGNAVTVFCCVIEQLTHADKCHLRGTPKKCGEAPAVRAPKKVTFILNEAAFCRLPAFQSAAKASVIAAAIASREAL